VSHRRSGLRAVAGVALTALAVLLVWFALVAPNDLSHVSPGAFVRLPLEALVVLVVLLVLPWRAARVVALIVGLVLGLLVIGKVLDTAFLAAIGRPFNPAVDLGYLGSAVDLVGDAVGHTNAVVATVVAGVVAVALLVLAPLAVLRLARIADRHRGTSLRAVVALGVAWIVCAVLGLQLAAGMPIASTSAAGLAGDEVRQVYAGIEDRQGFATAAAHDVFAQTPGTDLLTGLRGKDVLVVFVESYGRVAVQDTTFSPGVDAVLDAGTEKLRSVGFATESAFLTSPTYGGLSWLAHSTLQSGLWIDGQPRYDELMTRDRLTLSVAFKRAGWRTVADIPPDSRDWPQGTSFYHYDAIYDSRNVGYVGPHFSYAPVPDQYTLATFRRLELAKAHRAPVMAEIDLVSSHTPWTPLPRMVPWNQLGDGSIYDPMPAEGLQPSVAWRDPSQVRALYGQSIEYSLNSIISFVQKYQDPNLVLVVLGDHQPASIVSGEGPNRDVPITIVAHDPAVLDQISSWGWQQGMRPSPDAPVWPMDAFRDRFLEAFGRSAGRQAAPAP
jgi:hypothetical protein